MNFFTQAEIWVAANQVAVMVAFVSVFVAFHLLLLVNAVSVGNEENRVAIDTNEQQEEKVWATYFAYHPMMF